jgi:hypothetical protein
MAVLIRHRRVNIVTLDPGETIGQHCRGGDIAIVQAADGWWTHFVADDGTTETYDAPFPTHQQAVWTAKAAAEFMSSE